MEEIVLELIKTIDNHVVEQDIRVAIYSEVIPHLRWVDVNVAESFKDESEAYAEAYEMVLDTIEEDFE